MKFSALALLAAVTPVAAEIYFKEQFNDEVCMRSQSLFRRVEPDPRFGDRHTQGFRRRDCHVTPSHTLLQLVLLLHYYYYYYLY